MQIGVGNTAPSVTIDAPVDNALFRSGDTVALRGSASDPEEGPLPPSALRWRVTLHHADHIHPVTDLNGVAETTFTTQTDHDADSYYEIVLTATDSSGLSGSKSVSIRPETVTLNLQSSPAGAPLAYAGRSVTAPVSQQAAIGFRTSISADPTFAVGGRMYGFDSWSDAGAASHNITIPATATTLTANYRDIGPSGLVAAYNFDEASGASVSDTSGNGNIGSISGAVRTAAGKYGGALSFDGVNDMVTVPDSNSLDVRTGMTLEAWVNPTVANGWRTAILKETPGDLVYGLYAVASYGGAVRPSAWIGSSADIGGTGPPPTGQWTHIATTYDGATWRLYVNGTQVASKPFVLQVPTSAGALRIGGNAIWSEWFAGAIDDVRIYDKGLSALEVARDRDTPVGGAVPPPPPDTAPPTVSLSSPADGASLRGTTTVTATASDNIGVSGVQFKVDGQNLGAEDTTSPYSASWDTTTASNGAHTITAVARDAAANTKTATAAVTVDNQAPTVGVTAPSAGANVSGASVNVAASASDNVAVAGVQFRLDGQNLGAEDTTAPYSVSWDSTTAANGSHNLTAIARDSAGNSTTATTVPVTVNNAPPPDNTAPTVSITAPASGALLRGSATVTAAASDNVGVTSVQFRLDGQDLGAPDTSTPYSAAWDTTSATNGSHTLTAIARDAAGNTKTATDVVVTVDNQNPTASITAPSAGSTVSGSTVSVTADAADNVVVAGVQFRLDGQNLGGEDTTAPYSVSWDSTTAANGSHNLTAVARDSAGNTVTAATVGVTVANAAPSGLVAAYGFEEAGTTVNDASGKGNTGTISGATRITTGKNGGGLSFDGVNDIVTVPDANSLDLTTGMTLEAWVYPTALTGWRTAILKETTGDLAYGLYVVGAPRPSAWIGADGLNGTATLPVNTWSHLASTYDGANWRLYVNGTQVATRAYTKAIPVSAGALRLGGNTVWTEWFQGRLDDVRIYNRGLAAAEVVRDKDAAVGP